jgi:hypothetical protein
MIRVLGSSGQRVGSMGLPTRRSTS